MTIFTSPFAIPIVAIGGAFLFSIIGTIVAAVRDIVKHRNEIELKQTMLDRGMSVEEIERICRATPVESKKKCC